MGYCDEMGLAGGEFVRDAAGFVPVMDDGNNLFEEGGKELESIDEGKMIGTWGPMEGSLGSQPEISGPCGERRSHGGECIGEIDGNEVGAGVGEGVGEGVGVGQGFSREAHSFQFAESLPPNSFQRVWQRSDQCG